MNNHFWYVFSQLIYLLVTLRKIKRIPLLFVVVVLLWFSSFLLMKQQMEIRQEFRIFVVNKWGIYSGKKSFCQVNMAVSQLVGHLY